MKIIIDLVIVAAILLALRHRSSARAIKSAADREVYAQASDARFPRKPKSRNPFTRKTGLK